MTKEPGFPKNLSLDNWPLHPVCLLLSNLNMFSISMSFESYTQGIRVFDILFLFQHTSRGLNSSYMLKVTSFSKLIHKMSTGHHIYRAIARTSLDDIRISKALKYQISLPNIDLLFYKANGPDWDRRGEGTWAWQMVATSETGIEVNIKDFGCPEKQHHFPGSAPCP